MRVFPWVTLFLFLMGCQTTPTTTEDASDTLQNIVTGDAVAEAVTPDYTLTMQTIETQAALSDALIKKIAFVPKYVLVDVDSIIAFVNAGFPSEPVKIIRRDAHGFTTLYQGELTAEKPLYFHVTKPGAQYQLLCVRTECSASIEVKP